MKRSLALLFALVLLCSSALADHGSVSEWDSIFRDIDKFELLEDANEALQPILFEHYSATSGVKVPAGTYLVGVDIPAGVYRIEYHGPEMSFASFLATNEETVFGFSSIIGFSGASEIGKIELTDGTTVQISAGDVYFYAYTGIIH